MTAGDPVRYTIPATRIALKLDGHANLLGSIALEAAPNLSVTCEPYAVAADGPDFGIVVNVVKPKRTVPRSAVSAPTGFPTVSVFLVYWVGVAVVVCGC
jgi:hypothetical protein